MNNLNISPCKNIIFKKTSSERNQNPSRYHNSIITNLKFQHKSKYHLSKNPHIKIDLLLLLLLPRGQNPLRATKLYNESKHNVLAYQGKANKVRMANQVPQKIPQSNLSLKEGRLLFVSFVTLRSTKRWHLLLRSCHVLGAFGNPWMDD